MLRCAARKDWITESPTRPQWPTPATRRWYCGASFVMRYSGEGRQHEPCLASQPLDLSRRVERVSALLPCARQGADPAAVAGRDTPGIPACGRFPAIVEA